jgi:FixJ family two-component response regulator
MPKKSGYDIFAAAKGKNPSLPVVFMTGFGYDPNHSVIRARQEGLSGVLYKPFKVDELLSLLRDAVREANEK